MRNYIGEEKRILKEVICNKCGKKIKVENGIVKEGCFSANPSFGYFSEKDGTRHQFDLCEVCYDVLVRSFVIPVVETEENELC